MKGTNYKSLGTNLDGIPFYIIKFNDTLYGLEVSLEKISHLQPIHLDFIQI